MSLQLHELLLGMWFGADWSTFLGALFHSNQSSLQNSRLDRRDEKTTARERAFFPIRTIHDIFIGPTLGWRESQQLCLCGHGGQRVQRRRQHQQRRRGPWCCWWVWSGNMSDMVAGEQKIIQCRVWLDRLLLLADKTLPYNMLLLQ